MALLRNREEKKLRKDISRHPNGHGQTSMTALFCSYGIKKKYIICTYNLNLTQRLSKQAAFGALIYCMLRFMTCIVLYCDAHKILPKKILVKNNLIHITKYWGGIQFWKDWDLSVVFANWTLQECCIMRSRTYSPLCCQRRALWCHYSRWWPETSESSSSRITINFNPTSLLHPKHLLGGHIKQTHLTIQNTNYLNVNNDSVNRSP